MNSRYSLEQWDPESQDFIQPAELAGKDQTSITTKYSPRTSRTVFRLYVGWSVPGAQTVATILSGFVQEWLNHMYSLESRNSITPGRTVGSFSQFCTVQTSRSCTTKSSCVERDSLWKVGQEKLEPWYRSASSHRPKPPLWITTHAQIGVRSFQSGSCLMLSDNR